MNTLETNPKGKKQNTTSITETFLTLRSSYSPSVEGNHYSDNGIGFLFCLLFGVIQMDSHSTCSCLCLPLFYIFQIPDLSCSLGALMNQCSVLCITYAHFLLTLFRLPLQLLLFLISEERFFLLAYLTISKLPFTANLPFF